MTIYNGTEGEEGADITTDGVSIPTRLVKIGDGTLVIGVERLYSNRTVALLMDVGIQTVANWIRSGLLATKVTMAGKRIEHRELVRFINTRREAFTPDITAARAGLEQWRANKHVKPDNEEDDDGISS